MKICHTCQQTYSEDLEFCPRDGARLAARATETEAQLAAGLSRRFRIVRRLGAGGMGRVFLVEQIGVGNRPVALKVLNRKLLDDPEFLLRFQNEAASTGRIHHPNVVTIYESGQADDGTPYIAMEFLEGESLRQALARRGALPVAEVAEILQQAARGLNAAHKLGIIHRDLKPDNIFLTYPDDDAVARVSPPANGLVESVAPVSPPANVQVKIVDFGIAKLRESGAHTQTGMVLGTPAYMSFEQASGMRSDELDARSDVYSLGVVVYEMLTGRTPFQSDTPVGYLRMHMQEDPPPFRTVKPDLPALPQLESVVMKALIKDRNQRYSSVLEFAHEFAQAATAVSTPAARPEPLQGDVKPQPQATTSPAPKTIAPTAVQDAVALKRIPEGHQSSQRKWLVVAACFVFLLVAATGVFWYSRGPKPRLAYTLFVLEHTLTGHDDDVNGVAFSPDGEMLASGSNDGTIKLWDVATGTQSQTLTGSSELVDSIAISPDGKLLASRSVTPVFGPDNKIREPGREDYAIRFWDMPTGALRKTLPGHEGTGNSIAFSPDGKLLASSGVGFTPDGQQMLASSVASGPDGVELLEVATGIARRALRGPYKSISDSGAYEKEVDTVAFSPDGKLLAAGTRDGTINLWDVATGTLRQWPAGTDTVTGHSETVETVAFSPDGKSLATGSIVVGIKLWDVATGKLTKTLTSIHPPTFPSAWSVAFSPDGKLLASGMDDGTIGLWDMPTGNLKKTLKGHESIVSCIAFSPDGKLLASGSWDKTIKLWRVAQ